MHPQSTSRQQFVAICQCGCGQPTLLASETNHRSGSVRGQPLRYLVNHHPGGTRHPRYKGRTISRLGYAFIFCPDHPHANKDGGMQEHRLVMESMIGRYLRDEEVVHHIDGNKLNNAPENLQLFANQGEHSRLAHGTSGRWSRDYDACIVCGTTSRPYAGNGQCRTCYMRLTRRAAGGRPGMRH